MQTRWARLNITIPLLLVAYILIETFVTFSDIKPPSTDFFLFKEPGIRFAQTGVLAAKNLPHQSFGEVVPYSYYPPVFPAAFGAWTKLVGVGLTQSNLFDWIVRVFRTLALVYLLTGTVAGRELLKKPLGIALLLGLSLFSSDGDRPDDLAIVFGLVSPACSLRKNHILSGLSLGLCGATSPVGGLIFAGATVVMKLAQRQIRQLLCITAVAFGSFVVVALPMLSHIKDTTAMKQAPLSNLPWFFLHKAGWSLTHAWLNVLSKSSQVGLAYQWLSLNLMLVLLVLVLKKEVPNPLKPLAILGVALPILILLLWTLQPYYFWFHAVFALGIILNTRALSNSRQLLAWVFIAFLPLMAQKGKRAVLFAFQDSQSSLTQVQAAIKRVLPLGASIGAFPDQYFTLANEFDVSNIGYVCDHLDQLDYAYLTPRGSRIHTEDEFSCPQFKNCFRELTEVGSPRSISILGASTGIFSNGYGGVLYKNTHCHTFSNDKPKSSG